MSNRKNGKEEMKLSMFANTMLISIENPGKYKAHRYEKNF